MEGFGIFTILIMAIVFFGIAISSIADKFTSYQLPDDKWKCTSSMAISKPGVKPVIEECTQYNFSIDTK